jgi:uncharacterized RDD family membrane protein YckC
MNKIKVPLKISGIDENLYAGFFVRGGSYLIDLAFGLIMTLISMFIMRNGKVFYCFTLILNGIFHWVYYIYFPKEYGGTPGKLILKIKIIRIDGESIGWREAILRDLFMLIFTIINDIILLYLILRTDNTIFKEYTWEEYARYIISQVPSFFSTISKILNIWTLSEFIILLLNKRKKALHDYIAGTLVIKEKYYEDIHNIIKQTEGKSEISNDR